MTYDKQDLLLDLRKLGATGSQAQHTIPEAHRLADVALLKFIDDEHVTAAYEAIDKDYA